MTLHTCEFNHFIRNDLTADERQNFCQDGAILLFLLFCKNNFSLWCEAHIDRNHFTENTCSN